MDINNVVMNSGFESNSLQPWVSLNGLLSKNYSHTGSFSVILQGGNINAFLYQFVPAMAGESFEFLVSIGKLGYSTPSTVTLQISYYDDALNFLGYGLIESIDVDRIPNPTVTNTWLEAYQNTSPAPSGTTQALILVNKLAAIGVADLVIDDIELLTATGSDLVGPTGPTGAQGLQGITGAQGLQGDRGVTGAQGLQGDRGVTGAQGLQGDRGVTGAQGLQGDRGVTGAQGLQGARGVTGAQGLQGARGITGAQGLQGDRGVTGVQGLQGIPGTTGPQGLQGARGVTGAQGLQGARGVTGAQGLQGARGITGAQGLQGARGVTGVQGLQGVRGITGAQGLQGARGVTGAQGLQGARGVTGAQGLQGARGVTGAQGLQGVRGATGAQGLQGVRGITGAQGLIGLQGLQGLQGIRGVTGPQGPQGNPSIFFDQQVATIPIYPPLNTEITVNTVSVTAITGNIMKIDFAIGAVFASGENYNISYEARLYRNGILINSRVITRSGISSGTSRIPVSNTFVDISPIVGINLYEVRMIVTTASSITSFSAINRNLNIIKF
ncbi:NTTRR-F1 domain [Priestia koreensis]|uniref:NTTRR-F1 domain n=1 Tax=Priestia koreensis TaxID=284581 RepID=UPI003458CC7E